MGGAGVQSVCVVGAVVDASWWKHPKHVTLEATQTRASRTIQHSLSIIGEF